MFLDFEWLFLHVAKWRVLKYCAHVFSVTQCPFSSPRKVRLCASSSAYLHLRQTRNYLHAVTESSWCFYLECLFHLAALQQLIGGVTRLLKLENMFVLMFSNQKRVSEYSTRTGARALMKTSAPLDLDVFLTWIFSCA